MVFSCPNLNQTLKNTVLKIQLPIVYLLINKELVTTR